MTYQESRLKFITQLASFFDEVEKKAKAQYEYNIVENVARKILVVEDCAEHAVHQGIVSAISAMNKWDIDKTIEIAADICEDSNCHNEAALLRATLVTDIVIN